MSDNINLRCSECGEIRKPIISPMIPDHLVILCETCWNRDIEKQLKEPMEMFKPEYPDPSKLRIVIRTDWQVPYF